MKISLVIITKNEEKNIAACIRSFPSADEVIVVDSGSTDRTEQICREFGARFIHNAWPGYGRQKQFAIESAKNDWVLSLDADEYLTKELADEIVRLGLPAHAAYTIARKQIFLGAVCEYGKSVDHPVRLFDRTKGGFDLKDIHEAFVTTGSLGALRGHMLHNSGVSVMERCKKIMRDLELELRNDTDPDVSVRTVVLDPLRYFASYYFKHQGFRDGLAGFVMTALFSIHVFLRNSARYERKLLGPRAVERKS